MPHEFLLKAQTAWLVAAMRASSWELIALKGREGLCVWLIHRSLFPRKWFADLLEQRQIITKV